MIAFFAVAAVLLAAFAWWELRARFPMLDLRVFRDPRMALGSLTILVAFFGMFGMFFLVTQFLQFSQGHSPLAAALRLLPVGFVVVIAAPRGAALAARYGPRPVVAGGLLLTAIGLVGLGSLAPDDPYALLLLALAATAAGMGLAMPSATSAIVSSVPQAKAGVASAINDITREVGGALGIAIVGSAMSAAYRDRIEGALDGLSPANADLAGESVGVAIAVASAVGGPEGAALRTAAKRPSRKRCSSRWSSPPPSSSSAPSPPPASSPTSAPSSSPSNSLKSAAPSRTPRPPADHPAPPSGTRLLDEIDPESEDGRGAASPWAIDSAYGVAVGDTSSCCMTRSNTSYSCAPTTPYC